MGVKEGQYSDNRNGYGRTTGEAIFGEGAEMYMREVGETAKRR